MNAKQPSTSPESSPTEFIILGSGVSTAIPRIGCIIRSREGVRCQVCHDALQNPLSKNRRCNVAALVRASGRTVLIDCGKTIREASMRHFPKLAVSNIDAIVLTHGHADAILGLDDARDIQEEAVRVVEKGKVTWKVLNPTPVYLNEETMSVCRNMFPYLVPKIEEPPLPTNPPQKKDIQRRVAAIDWRPYGEDKYFEPFRPVPDADIEFTPFPMYHGGDYICMGFLIRVRQSPDAPETVIAYLSDLHKVPSDTMEFLKRLERIDLMVVDILTFNSRNRSHFSAEDAQNLARELRPVKTVAVGMTCSIGLHDTVNAKFTAMLEEGIDFQLAYDGQRFPCE